MKMNIVKKLAIIVLFFLNATKDLSARELSIIGHSIGSPCALRLAEEAATPFDSLYLIAPFTKTLGISGYDELNASFVEHVFDWEKIKRGADRFFCFAGDNDPYVPLKTSKEVADKLGSSLKIILGGGHLNAESGYTSFPELLHHIISK